MADTRSDTLARLEGIKEHLVALKLDRSKYLSLNDFVAPYKEYEEILARDARIESDAELLTATSDVLLIFSLGLLTVGLSRQAPATYATLLVLKPLLLHLSYVPNFTPNEVQVLARRLDEIEEILRSGAPRTVDITVGPVVRGILERELTATRELLTKVEAEVNLLAEDEVKPFSQLLHLRREILNYIVDPGFEADHLALLRNKLGVIVTHMNEIVAKDGPNRQLSHPLAFQLQMCQKFTTDFAQGPKVDPSWEGHFEKLKELDKTLRLFLVTHRWTLRETDLYRVINKLLEIQVLVAALVTDPLSFVPGLHVIKPGYVLSFFLLRRCLAQVYKLLDSAEPVTEALVPVHNNLLTTKRCLLEVKDLGGISNLRELYPYQMKLASLDNMRQDGKFMVDGEVPTGQSVLNGLLAECFDLVYDLQVDLEERSPDSYATTPAVSDYENTPTHSDSDEPESAD